MAIEFNPEYASSARELKVRMLQVLDAQMRLAEDQRGRFILTDFSDGELDVIREFVASFATAD
jgi:hypothetical protein